MAQGITSLEEIMSVDKRDIIRCNAFSLLMQRGYAKTSYTAIAELSGRKRTLVQYYYPKRASFAGFRAEAHRMLVRVHRAKACRIGRLLRGFLHQRPNPLPRAAAQ